MTIYGSFAGVRIVSGRISIPEAGLWSADLMLASADDITSPGTLKLGDLELAGAVFRSTAFAGQRHVRLVGGAGGWSKTIPAQGYQNDGGVSRSIVLGDAAKAVGETVQIAADGSLGTAFVREVGPAARTLRAVAGDAWWMAPDGTTRVGPRDGAGQAIGSDFLVAKFNGGTGLAEIATEHLADWTPGKTFTSSTIPSPQTIGAVSIEIEPEGKLRVQVLTRTASSTAGQRILAGFRGLLRDADPRRTFAGTFEYAVQDSDGVTASLAVVDTTQPVPDLVSVPLRGMAVTPTEGALCLVVFVNGDPTRPAIVAVDPISKKVALDATDLLELGKSATVTKIAGGILVVQAVARANDPVQAGPFSGIIVAGSPGVACGNG